MLNSFIIVNRLGNVLDLKLKDVEPVSFPFQLASGRQIIYGPRLSK